MRIVMGAMIALLLTAATPALAEYAIGEPVADFTLLDLQGTPVSLSDFAGQVVLINFFATWCPPCNDEVPLLEDMWQTYRDQGFVVLGIDLLEDPAVVAAWAQNRSLSYPIILATDWSLFQLFPQAGGFPYNAVIDQSGVLRYSQYGINIEEIDGLVRQLLPEDPVTNRPAVFGSVKALFR